MKYSIKVTVTHSFEVDASSPEEARATFAKSEDYAALEATGQRHSIGKPKEIDGREIVTEY